MKRPAKLLVTGFGPFPGAPENPTEALVDALAGERPALGASDLKVVVLPTEYRRSWSRLRRLYATFEPDKVVHFGLSGSAKVIHVETTGVNIIDPTKPDASGTAPPMGRARRGGCEKFRATLPTEVIVAALRREGIAALLSDDAGTYVCNATLYRSLHAAPRGRRVGFIHVPHNLEPDKMLAAARIILRTICAN
jgi:pyroglutamyl-peptidase